MTSDPLGPLISALFVERGGVYYGLDDVDPWDEERDARLYPGPWPVVAHPPCSVWSQLASVNHKRWDLIIGDDGGCFASALDSVQRYGGVLEHPAFSKAWEWFGLPRPERGCWRWDAAQNTYVTEISQAVYGHDARKRTWLYAVGIDPRALDWSDAKGTRTIGSDPYSNRGRVQHKHASRTPIALRDALLDLARSVDQSEIVPPPPLDLSVFPPSRQLSSTDRQRRLRARRYAEGKHYIRGYLTDAPRVMRSKGEEPPHGTAARYNWSYGACRCTECRAARAAYMRDLRQRKKESKSA